MSTAVFNVAGMSCQHCVDAITSEVNGVEGVSGVDVDLTAGTVSVTGVELDESALRAAIDEAGYDVADAH
ncbi:MAG: heavy-metal-associated domain-containing protein [Candidatus Nanopelagicales bacterium]